ncbi:hypothetical protein JVX90_09730 [Gordonia sp. PDNC005]|uniref:hypothetical protein n=1 Tax=unclassified Gordonia (in: high G+C Gram-positive bacteria) TaxID=2657482 RepID=UPI001963ADAF|nr:hypothetical protein [Gordonia sp. PDNC005]QRY64416.1 hypothetical protein JVX90_09730 [Gordonia sp. PDNC005]
MPRTTFFDSEGAPIGSFAAWQIPEDNGPAASLSLLDRKHFPLVRSWTGEVGVLDVDAGKFRWTHQAHAPAIRVVDDRHLVTVADDIRPSDDVFRTMSLVDLASGEPSGSFSTKWGRWLLGYDGTRLILAGDPDAQQQPNSPRLAAVDPSSGAIRWEFVAPDRNADWKQAGPLLLLTGATGYREGYVARYS